MQSDRHVTFGAFRLDPVDERLLRGDEAVPLTPKAFAVLRRLVAAAGQLVRKDELLRAGWADTHVTEAVLKVSILEIRRALGDDSTAPRFIETVPRRGYRFIAARARAEPPAGMCGELVGRDAILAQLEALLARARAGQRQMAFLSGEAGIGKTSVLDAFLAHAGADPDLWIARGDCLQHHGVAEAYLPVLEALGRLTREPHGERVLPVLETHAPTWLTQLPSLVRRADHEPSRADRLGTTKERMLREMAEALEALAIEAPLVLVLEDLHWSDYSTLDLLAMLGRRQEGARLLVLGTYRPVDVIVAGHPLRALTQELRIRRQCEDIALAFLGEADVCNYLARRFGGHRFPPELAAALHRRTDGNPLFMVRLVDELVTLGVLAEAEGWRLQKPLEEIARAVPESLRQLIEQQVGRLGPSDERMLEAASELGIEFAAHALAAALEEDPVAVEERCDALARQGHLLAPAALLVLPEGAATGRYRFTHSLYPHVLAARVAAGRRLRLHHRVGEWLERTYGAQADEVGAELARHFEEAHEYRRAIGYLQRAAHDDVARCAHQGAVARLAHAVALAGRLPLSDADAVYPLLLEQLGRVRRSVGDVHAALRDFEALAAWARDRGQIGWQAKAALYRASVLSWVNPEGSRVASTEAVTLGARVEDPGLRAHLLGYSAYWRLERHGWRADDARVAEEAVVAARTAGDRELLSEGLARLTAFQRAHSEFRSAARTAREGLELARATGNTYDYLSCAYFGVQALHHLGEWGAALESIGDGLRVAAQSGHLAWESLLRSELAALHLEALDFAGAAVLARAELARAPTNSARRKAIFALAFALLGLGRLDEAYAAFTAPQLAGIDKMSWFAQVPLRHGLGLVWLARRQFDRARREADALADLATTASDPTAAALAARLLADVALASGRLPQADASVRDAVAAIGSCEAPVAEWRIAATAARVYDRQRRRGAADAARRRCAALVGRLADSLPPGHMLRASLLADRAARPAHRRGIRRSSTPSVG